MRITKKITIFGHFSYKIYVILQEPLRRIQILTENKTNHRRFSNFHGTLKDVIFGYLPIFYTQKIKTEHDKIWPGIPDTKWPGITDRDMLTKTYMNKKIRVIIKKNYWSHSLRVNLCIIIKINLIFLETKYLN